LFLFFFFYFAHQFGPARASPPRTAGFTSALPNPTRNPPRGHPRKVAISSRSVTRRAGGSRVRARPVHRRPRAMAVGQSVPHRYDGQGPVTRNPPSAPVGRRLGAAVERGGSRRVDQTENRHRRDHDRGRRRAGLTGPSTRDTTEYDGPDVFPRPCAELTRSSVTWSNPPSNGGTAPTFTTTTRRNGRVLERPANPPAHRPHPTSDGSLASAAFRWEVRSACSQHAGETMSAVEGG